jgi:hypothetical protein
MKAISVSLCGLIMLIWLTACPSSDSGEEPGARPPYLNAEFTVVEWVYEHGSTLDWVEITYSVENTGQYPIDYYEVDFRVWCLNLTVYSDWANGGDIMPGTSSVKTVYIYTLGEEIIDVGIWDWAINNHDLGWYPAL